MLTIKFSQEHSTPNPILDTNTKSPYYEAVLRLSDQQVFMFSRIIEGHADGTSECVTVNLESGNFVREQG